MLVDEMDDATVLREAASAVECAHKNLCQLKELCRSNQLAGRLRELADRASRTAPATREGDCVLCEGTGTMPHGGKAPCADPDCDWCKGAAENLARMGASAPPGTAMPVPCESCAPRVASLTAALAEERVAHARTLDSIAAKKGG